MIKAKKKVRNKISKKENQFVDGNKGEGVSKKEDEFVKNRVSKINDKSAQSSNKETQELRDINKTTETSQNDIINKKEIVKEETDKDIESTISSNLKIKESEKEAIKEKTKNEKSEIEKAEGKQEEKENKQDKKIKKPKIDVAAIAKEIREEQIRQQRGSIKDTLDGVSNKDKKTAKKFIKTGIAGFDELLEEGIPKGNTVLIAGGAGSGKTIFCLQIIASQANKEKKCLYMSFEENEEKLIKHMEDFAWNPRELIKRGNLRIFRTNPFDITRNVDALLAKQKGELLIDIDPVIIPKDFKPDFIFLDSLTAIASAFTGKEESYRIYIEQLFRFFEEIGATSFLITETEQIPKIFSTSGVEEFLADGVVVLYNLKHGNVRENAIEILKLRGAGHQKKIVAMQITKKGIVVYPQQEVFSEI